MNDTNPDSRDGEASEWMAIWEATGDMDMLADAIYREIRAMAAGFLSRERRNHTLQPTALANEAFIRLMKMKQGKAQGHPDLKRLVACMMRNILIDHARRRNSRAGSVQMIALDDANIAYSQMPAEETLAVHLAIEKLSKADKRLGTVVVLHHDGGFTLEEVAEIEGLSKATVERDWRIAKAFLKVELSKGVDKS